MSDCLDHFEKYLMDWLETNSSTDGQSLTPQRIKEVYSIAYRLYRDQHYDQAVPFFRLLLLIGPSEAKYWKGLGACLQMQNDYEQAIRCYICAQLFQREPDPYLYVHAADCYFALGEVEQGLKALDGARLSAEEQNDEKVLQHVTLMRQLWANR